MFFSTQRTGLGRILGGAHNPNINQQNGGVKKEQVKGCGSVNRPTPGSQWPAEPATSGFLQGVNFAIFRGQFGGLGVKLGVVDDRFSQCRAILHGVTIGVVAIFGRFYASRGERSFPGQIAVDESKNYPLFSLSTASQGHLKNYRGVNKE